MTILQIQQMFIFDHECPPEEEEKPIKKSRFSFSFRKKSKPPDEPSVADDDDKSTDKKTELKDDSKSPEKTAPYPKQEWKLKNFFKSKSKPEKDEEEKGW